MIPTPPRPASTRSTRVPLSRRGAAVLTMFAMLLASAVVVAPGATPEAAAENGVPELQQRTDEVVTSDALPTVQIDSGYVWAQTMIGDTVYAVGDFDNARAPLAAPGTELTPRSNVLAFDIETGALLPFAPKVNGVIKAVAASPDGTRIYIGGSFNQVNGQDRWNIAALDAQTGELIPGFRPAIGGTGVFSLVAGADTVYAGGLFTQANGVARKNLAGFATGNGALAAWAPQPDRQVDAMVADPAGKNIVLGGRFAAVNGNTELQGVGAVDRITGAVDTEWKLTDTVQNARGSGTEAGQAGIFSLAADDSGVYGTGWVFGASSVRNLEGTFAAEADTGDLRWLADCHGDHYGVFSTGSTVYATGHTHSCETAGLQPEQSPQQMRYVEAYTADARGVLGPNRASGYKNWEGTPAPAPYAWYPDFLVGTATGLGQAGLSITGNDETISVAGEFVGVNNARYQGIVRFSSKPPTGAKDGPRLRDADWKPSASSTVPGQVRVTIPGNWDRDDRDLTYELRRSNLGEPVDTVSKSSSWWDRPPVALVDESGEPGVAYTYTVVARDGDGNTVRSEPVTATRTEGTVSSYSSAVLDDDPVLYHPLGNTPAAWAGTADAVVGSQVTALPEGIENSSTGASRLPGTSTGLISSGGSAVTAPTTYSTELWFRTSSTRGGKLIGFGNSRTGTSTSYDRHVYMGNDGRLMFGTYPSGSARVIRSESSYNDGQWHHVVASQGPDGMTLSVDGEEVAADPSTTGAQRLSGYWRIGGDSLSGWPYRPSSDRLAGDIDEVAVYGSPLPADRVQEHFRIGRGWEAPTAAFTATTDGLGVQLDATESAAADGTELEAWEWDLGDGSTTEGATASHEYDEPGTYTVTLTVTDGNGQQATTTQEIEVKGANQPPVASLDLTSESLTVEADGSASSDADGAVSSYEWDWGDGATGSGETATHRYAEPGTYEVTLTVTDDLGATHTVTDEISVEHTDPVARFEAGTDGGTLSVDASASTASDEATLTYAWDWGDGSEPAAASEQPTAEHTFDEPGTYPVTLEVTDSYGASHSSTTDIVIEAPQEQQVAADSFERTASRGWGTADIGGAWALAGGGTAAASVSGGRGSLALPAGEGRTMSLPSTEVLDSGSRFTYGVSAPPTSGALYVGLESRRSGSEAYRSLVWHRADGTRWLVIQRNGVPIATKPVPGAAWTSGERFHIATETTGTDTVTIRVKTWRDGEAEPATWQLEATDTAPGALGESGAPGIYAYRSSSASGPSTVTIDDLSVDADPAARPRDALGGA